MKEKNRNNLDFTWVDDTRYSITKISILFNSRNSDFPGLTLLYLTFHSKNNEDIFKL